MTDRSNGYEGVAVEFLAGRGRAPSTAIGTRRVRDWARTLPSGAAVLIWVADLVCGLPRSCSTKASTFDGVVAWGLMFLLPPQEQRRFIQRIADILAPRGRLLVTAEAHAVVWNDAMTGLKSRSLGAAEYRGLLVLAFRSSASMRTRARITISMQ